VYYGYAGREAGFPRWLLEAGAGLYNGWQYYQRHGVWPWFWRRTWFDDPIDNAAIRAGEDVYESTHAARKRVNILDIRKALREYPELEYSPLEGK